MCAIAYSEVHPITISWSMCRSILIGNLYMLGADRIFNALCAGKGLQPSNDQTGDVGRPADESQKMTACTAVF
jgi:hypothetical protein